MAEVAAGRQTIERQGDRIAVLERENGRHVAELERAASTIVALGADNEALKASQAKQDANPGPVAPMPTTGAQTPLTGRLRALTPWVLAVLAIIAVVALLTWPR